MKQEKQFAGLTEAQVLESRTKYGTNLLTPPKRDPWWKLFGEKFNDPIIRILLIAALLSLGISFVHQEFAETIGIFCAIFLSVGVAFWFELDANKKFDILNQVNDDTLVKVVRNGQITEIPKRDIVVGDLIVLEAGDEIPADAKLTEAISLQVNESSLTGEPVVEKTTRAEDFDTEATYPSNFLYRGTTIVDGHCMALVTEVGDATEFGKVAREATKMGDGETPLNKQLEGLAKLIGVVGFSLAALTFVALFLKDIFSGAIDYSYTQLYLLGVVITGGMVAMTKIWLPIVYDGFSLAGKEKELPCPVKNGSWLYWLATGLCVMLLLAGAGRMAGINPFDPASWISIDEVGRILQYFMVSITLIVVAVPEGLPMSVTLSLALSMRRMLKTNNLVRKMHACETMGATTVICTDKTGTLTKNQMQVYETCFYALKDQKIESNPAPIASLIKEGIAANSTAFLDYSDTQRVKTLGNPTEAALLLWLGSQSAVYMDLRENAEVVEQLTFSTERKFMATLVDSPLLGKRILYVKGAPEIVFSKCSLVVTEEGEKDAHAYQPIVSEQLLTYQNQAMRTLGFAYKEVEKDDTRDVKLLVDSGSLLFLGVAAISDPVREDVSDAVSHCLNAGIQVKIVTGDTPGTAKEIGRQIGIWKENDTEENIITGVDFEALTDEEALGRVQKLKIMCRARPTDKQRLVQLLQKKGEVVAVTGDGTNDAPALNFAQVGLSMGSGTSVAKEASDITLLDDSFNSIATAVMWGRSLYRNIQRFLFFQLTINVTALAIVFLGSLFGAELPLTVTQMLWVNLIMDTFAAGALASLPPEPEVMSGKPRRNDAFIINRSMRFNILFTGFSFVALLLGLLYCFTNEGAISLTDLSRFFTVFVMLQFWNLFNAKAFQTGKSAFKGIAQCRSFLLVALLILAGQALIVEFGGEVFRTTPLPLKDWLVIVGATSIVLWIGELGRLLMKKTV